MGHFYIFARYKCKLLTFYKPSYVSHQSQFPFHPIRRTDQTTTDVTETEVAHEETREVVEEVHEGDHEEVRVVEMVALGDHSRSSKRWMDRTDGIFWKLALCTYILL